MCLLLAEVGGPHFKPTGRLEHFGASLLTGVYDDRGSEYIAWAFWSVEIWKLQSQDTDRHDRVVDRHDPGYTPSIAFRHLPPNSARFSYATEGALFISAQLSSDAVSALRKVRILI